MKTSNLITNKKKILTIIVLAGLFLTVAACSPDVAEDEGSDTIVETEVSPTEVPEPTDQTGGEPEQEVEGLEASKDQIACPSEDTNFELYASHDFWTDTGMGDWIWEAAGTVVIVVDASGNVAGFPTSAYPGRQYGEFVSEGSACTFEAPAEIYTSVSGTCSNGVLTLELFEDWQMGTYTWVCDEDTIQFEIPPMGSAQHSNLEFTLTESGNFERSIQWGGGSGSKSWTLMDAMEPVPLVTP
jgi:hypothetical protein